MRHTCQSNPIYVFCFVDQKTEMREYRAKRNNEHGVCKARSQMICQRKTNERNNHIHVPQIGLKQDYQLRTMQCPKLTQSKSRLE